MNKLLYILLKYKVSIKKKKKYIFIYIYIYNITTHYSNKKCNYIIYYYSKLVWMNED